MTSRGDVLPESRIKKPNSLLLRVYSYFQIAKRGQVIHRNLVNCKIFDKVNAHILGKEKKVKMETFSWSAYKGGQM